MKTETALTLEDLRARREEILRLAAKHGVRDVRVFGSVVRGEATPESDVDLLVNMEEGSGLFDRIDLMHELQDLLHAKMDIVPERGLHWFIRDRIIESAVPL